MQDSRAMDMTHGTLLDKILRFSFPLIATNVLQLMFSAADMVIIGQFSNYTSLAAVGSTISIIFLFLNVLIGLSVGVNVVIARYLGATGHDAEISRSVHTAITVALVGGFAVWIIASLFAAPILGLTSTPADVKDLATLYMRVYFVGTPALMIYNYGAAVLRAKGDTRRPLFFMTVSGIVKVALNILLVAVLKMDVAGVAIASVISQGLSAGLILFCLSRESGPTQFSFSKLCIDKKSLVAMARIGIPAGLQGCLFSISNMAIQKGINSYGSIETAASSASYSIESFVFTVMNAYHQTCQTFTSQNIGAGNYDRARKVLYRCAFCAVAAGAIASSVVLLFDHQIMSLYTTEQEVIDAGIARMWIVIPFYVLYGFSDVMMGGMYGRGYVIPPVLINLIGTCAFRVLWITWLDTPNVSVAWVYRSFPFSWVIIVTSLSLMLRYILRKETEKLQNKISQDMD